MLGVQQTTEYISSAAAVDAETMSILNTVDDVLRRYEIDRSPAAAESVVAQRVVSYEPIMEVSPKRTSQSHGTQTDDTVVRSRGCQHDQQTRTTGAQWSPTQRNASVQTEEHVEDLWRLVDVVRSMMDCDSLHMAQDAVLAMTARLSSLTEKVRHLQEKQACQNDALAGQRAVHAASHLVLLEERNRSQLREQEASCFTSVILAASSSALVAATLRPNTPKGSVMEASGGAAAPPSPLAVSEEYSELDKLLVECECLLYDTLDIEFL